MGGGVVMGESKPKREIEKFIELEYIFVSEYSEKENDIKREREKDIEKGRQWEKKYWERKIEREKNIERDR